MTSPLISNPEAEKIQSYPLFDWLRFALASIVVLGHVGFKFAPWMTRALAVQVFFALSGWLIGGILLKSQAKDMPRFFFNRATRIWIPYAIAIVMLYGVALLKEGAGFFWFKYLALDLTFTHQLFTVFPEALREMPMGGSGNQFWSIAVEEQFYLIAPVIMLFVPRGRTLPIWLAIVLMTLIFQWNAAAISMGVCGAIIEAKTGFSRSRLTALLASAAVIGLAFLLAASLWTPVVTPRFAVMVVIAAARPGQRKSLAVIAGGLSYPLYLNHWIGVFLIHFLAKRFLEIDQATFVICQYILNVTIALVLYWLIDRNIQKYRNDWYSPEVGRRLGAIAYGLVSLGLILGTLFTRYGPHG